jgi:hypothetical protein
MQDTKPDPELWTPRPVGLTFSLFFGLIELLHCTAPLIKETNMTLYDVETQKSLVRLQTGQLAWRELCEEFFRTAKCKCGRPYHRMLGGLKFTCECYSHMMFDIRNVPTKDLCDWLERQQAMN